MYPYAHIPIRTWYLVFGRETCPDSGRRHLQGFVAFKICTKFSTVRIRLPGAHIEKMRGTPEEALEYCKKDGDYTEYGALPTVAKASDVFKRCTDLAQSGDLESIKMDYPGYYIRYKSSFESMLKFDINELNGSCGIWIDGPPRCGKNYAVRSLKDVFVKSMNKWWDGYKNEKYVLISDVEPDHCK